MTHNSPRPPRSEATSLRVSVLIPCLDEALAIGDVVRNFRHVLPDAQLVVIDASEESLRLGRSMLPDAAIEWRAARWSPADERDFDLVVLPLAFVGAAPTPTRAVHLVHAWWTDRRGDRSVPVSFALFKRLSVLLPGSLR